MQNINCFRFVFTPASVCLVTTYSVSVQVSVCINKTGFPHIIEKSLKVLEFFNPKFKALKVLENRTGA